MTTPNIVPGAYDPDKANAAVDNFSQQLLGGGEQLVKNPGLVQAMATGNATPQQAQAVNQFLMGLNAQKKVTLAAAAGKKIPLAPDEMVALNNMGVDYSKVQYTFNDYTSNLNAVAAAKNMLVKYGPDGNPITDAHGNVIFTPDVAKMQAEVQPKKSSGGGGGWSLNPFSDAKKAAGDVVSPVAKAANMAYNVVDSSAAQTVSALNAATGGVFDPRNDLGPGGAAGAIASGKGGQFTPNLTPAVQMNPSQGGLGAVSPDSTEYTNMTALGYDPNNAFSVIAFKARGYAHGDTSKIADAWDQQNPNLFGMNGSQAVIEAEKYAENPKAYITGILAAKPGQSDTTLTPQQLDQLKLIQSKQFRDLTLRVNSKTSTLGNEFASSIGVDPVNHPLAYTLTAAAADTAASFAIDPTILLGKAYQGLKFSRIGLKSLGDTNRLATVLDPDTLGVAGKAGFGWRAQVQRSLQYVVDSSNKLRAAGEAGDTATMARIQAEVNAQAPLMGKLMQDFTGSSQVLADASGRVFRDSALDAEAGSEASKVFKNIGPGDPITTYKDAVQYLTSKNAMLRLYEGRAAVESTLMPGAVSRWGYRALRGKIAGAGAARLATQNIARDAAYAAARDAGTLGEVPAAVSAAAAAKAADPGQGIEKILTDDNMDKVLPSAQDAIDRAGNVIAEPAAGEAAGGLASARRALSASEKGEAAFGLRNSGKADGTGGVAGWASASAITARARLAQAKLTQLLPRDNVLHLDGSESVDKIGKFARTYLNAGDASLLQAQWTLGDGAARKAIAQSLMDQVFHSAGLSRTVLGNALIDSSHAYQETYTHSGDLIDPMGRAFTPHLGLVQDTFHLPAYTTIRKAAARTSAFEHTIGRVFESDAADTGKTFLNMNMLLKPSTALRLSIETILNAATRGELGDYIAAKSVSSDMLKNTSMDVKKWNRAFRNLPGMSAVGDFAKHVTRSKLSDREYEAMQKNPRALDEYLHDLAGAHQAADMDPGGTRDAAAIAENGMTPIRMQYDLASGKNPLITAKTAEGMKVRQIRTGFAPVSADGYQGAVRYATALAQRVNKTPGIAKAAIKYIQDGQSDIQPLLDAIESPENARLRNLSGYGHYVFDEQTGAYRDAVDDGEKSLAKQQFAQAAADDYNYLLKSAKGTRSQKLADYIMSNGKAPDHAWIMDNLKDADRPVAVNSAQYAAVPLAKGGGSIQKFAGAINDATGNGYTYMVEKPLQRMMSAPTYLMYYAKARVALEDTVMPKMLHEGLSQDAADSLIHNLAERQAVIASKDVLDDPTLKGQMDVVARNLLSFPRAAREMIRRWGQTLYQDPTRARKVQLGLEGAEHSGLVYNDSYGEPTFTFPGSGVMMGALGDIFDALPGFSGAAKVNTSGDMLGKVTSLMPGLNNPVQFSLSPMLNIPLRYIAALNPDHEVLWNEIDQVMNGPEGANRSALSEITPAFARQFLQAKDNNDRTSMTASATIGALANLKAAGQVPPAGATPAQIQEFLDNVRTHTRSQLFLRAAFGLFAPASPGAPEEGTDASKSDYAFNTLGVKNLSDEYKAILNMTDGDLARTNVIWATLHPDKLVYETPKSESTVQKSVLPATIKSAQWMESNLGFIHKYSDVAAYFIPNDPGQFSEVAYQTQMALGLREKKTPTEFYNQFQIQSAESQYYPQYDDYLAKYGAETDPAKKATMKAQWSAWTKMFKAANPLFAQKVTNFEDARAQAGVQLQDLHQMIKDNTVPNGWGGTLNKMVTTYDNYEAWKNAQKGETAYDKAVKVANALKFHQMMLGFVKEQPQLGDLYNGVFRSLDSNLFPTSDLTGGN